MNLVLDKLTKENAEEIFTWVYKAPYDVYNWPSWEEAALEGESITDDLKREEGFCGVFDEMNSLCGFAEFDKVNDYIRLGLGLKPELCGKGIGKRLMKLVIEEAKRRNLAGKIDLEVLIWNERAYKVYKESDFEIAETYERKTPTGISTFHRMIFTTK